PGLERTRRAGLPRMRRRRPEHGRGLRQLHRRRGRARRRGGDLRLDPLPQRGRPRPHQRRRHGRPAPARRGRGRRLRNAAHGLGRVPHPGRGVAPRQKKSPPLSIQRPADRRTHTAACHPGAALLEPIMATVKPIPDDMHSLTPHLTCDGAAEAIKFYVKAFNAVELASLPTPDGKIAHAAVRIGDSTLMLCDAFPEWGACDPKALKGSPVVIHLYVEDVDAAMAQAQAAGATVTMPATDMFWGDRYGQLTDPF